MKIYYRWVKQDFTYFKIKIYKHCLVCSVVILNVYLSKKEKKYCFYVLRKVNKINYFSYQVKTKTYKMPFTLYSYVIVASLMAHFIKILPVIQETGFNPWTRKIPWRRKWQSALVFLPGKSHGQRSLAGYSPKGHKSWTWLSD